MALHNVRELDNFAHIHRVCGNISNSAILWHRSHSKNSNFSDTDATKVRPICKACACGEQRQTGTDSNRYHKPLPTVPGHSFPIDAFCCTHRSIRGFKYCDLMNNASQMIYCNFIKSRAAEDMIKSFKLLWNLNFTWRVFDHAHPDPLNSRYIRMDPGTGYRSDTMLRFMADRRYKIKLTQPRDKHAGGITEHMVGIVTAKTNNAMLENRAPPSFWPCSRPHRT